MTVDFSRVHDVLSLGGKEKESKSNRNNGASWASSVNNVVNSIFLVDEKHSRAIDEIWKDTSHFWISATRYR